MGLFLATLPGFLLAGIQIVPALFLTPLTVRALGRFSLRHSLFWSASPWRLLELFVPFPFGNPARDRVIWGEGLWSGKTAGFFTSFWSGAFAAAGLLRHRLGRGRRLFLYGLGLLSFLFAAAGRFVPERLLEKASPLPLRYPEKLMVGVVLVLALLSGLAWDALRAGEARRLSRAAAAVALALAAAGEFCAREGGLVSGFVDRRWSPILHGGPAAAERMPALFAQSAALWAVLAGLLYLCGARPGRPALAAVVLFVLADLGAFRCSAITTEPEALVLSMPPAVRAARRIARPPRFGYLPLQEYITPDRPEERPRPPFRPLLDETRATLASDVGAAFGVFYSFNNDYDLSDFYRVELARREIARDAGRWPGLESYLAAYSARAAIVHGGLLPNGFPSPARVLKPDWLVANGKALPTIRFAGDVREARDIAEAFGAIHARSVDLSKTTVIETGRSGSARTAMGKIEILDRRPETLRLATEAAAPAVVVLTRAYSPYRSVLVDGEAATSWPADICLTAVPVPAGRHTVVVSEELPGGIAGAGLTLCGILLLIYLSHPRRSNAIS